MRKLLPAILIGIGAFLLTLALLMRFYAVPKLAVAPADQNSKTIVTGPHSRFLDVASLSFKTATLQTTATVIGDPEASKEASKEVGRPVVVWDKGTVTQWLDSSGKPVMPPLDGATERIVFDSFTGEAVNCCGETVDGKPVEHKGLLVKFPFFTEQKAYDYWDGSTGKAYPAEFKGEEEIDGLKVYRFEQEVPRTKTRDQEVPAKLLGLPDKPIKAQRYYQNHRTFLVEPTTGVVIKQTEEQVQQLEAPGAKPTTVLQTTSTFDDASVAKNVADYKSKSSQLAMIKGSGPISSGFLGLLLLVVGIVMSVLIARRGPQGAHAESGVSDETHVDATNSFFEEAGLDVDETTRRRSGINLDRG